jgi:cholesterol oxidase
MAENREATAGVAGRAVADVVVIGSGFGGAVAADRLIRAGLKVRVIERGPWRRTKPVLTRGLNHALPLPVQNRPGLIMRGIRSSRGPKEICLNRRGLLEFHLGKGVKVLSSSGVGGGSHVWSALVARPDDANYWNGRADGVSEAVMAPHYERVGAELGTVRPSHIEAIPNHTSHAWQECGWFDSIGEEEQYPFALLFPERNGGKVNGDRELSALNGEDGLFGSARAAKANVEAIFLLPHLDSGLKVHDLHEVKSVARMADGNFEVTAIDHHHGKTSVFYAPRVVIAAGTMNSLKILFESQESGALKTTECLGQGFGTNGDCMGIWTPDSVHRNSRLGSPIHGRLKTFGHPKGINLIVGGMDAPPVPDWAPSFVKDWISSFAKRRFQLITMGVDRAEGSVSFSKGRLNLEYDLSDSAVYQAAFDLFDALSRRTGKQIKFDRKSAMTAHAMGGCRIGSSPSEGVVDGEGQVYGNAGLYIADASVLPAPTGGPPSLTIAAWSSHVASRLLSKM